MSKRTYVCLDCRTAKRAEAAYGLNTNFRCSHCEGSVFELPWGWRIPKRTDANGWKKLQKFVSDIECEWLPRRHAEGRALLAKLEAQIEATSQRRDSETKNLKLKYLCWKRREVEKGYLEGED